MQRSTAVPQGLPSTSALSRHAIYQSFYLRSGGRSHRQAATGARRLRLSVSRLRVSVPVRQLWRVDNTQMPTLLYTLNEPQHTNTETLVVKARNGIGRYTGASTAPSPKQYPIRSRCRAARHASDRRSHPRTVQCSPLEGSAALHARRLRLSHDSSPLATSPRELWARAVLGTRVYSPTLTQARR